MLTIGIWKWVLWVFLFEVFQNKKFGEVKSNDLKKEYAAQWLTGEGGSDWEGRMAGWPQTSGDALFLELAVYTLQRFTELGTYDLSSFWYVTCQ